MLLFYTVGGAGSFSFQVMYYAVLIFQLVLVVLQSSYVRRLEYFYYSLYIICMGVYFLALNESLLQTEILFTRYPALQPFFDKPIGIFCVFLYYRFARYFMDIPHKYPVFNEKVKQIEYFILVGVFLEVCALALNGKSFIEEMCFVAISVITLVYTSYILYQYFNLKRSTLNYFALSGATLIAFGSFASLIAFNLINFHIINVNFIPSVPSQVASLFELIIFSTGLGYKTFLMEREKVIAERALVNELRENGKLQNNIQQLRNEIASDLHDDVGATLGSINVYADVSERMIEEGNKEEAKGYLHRIVELSKETLHDMRNMIWALNSEHDSLSELVQRMKDYAAPLLTAKNISFSFEIDEAVPEKKMEVLEKRNLFLIFKESIYNILKYADCKNVTVEIYSIETGWMFVVTDDGSGFDLKARRDGNGLNNLQRRAQEMNAELLIKSGRNEGTVVSLTFKN